MEIEILEYIPDAKNFRQGYVDFKVTYSPEKHEIFRNVGYFEKDNKKWLSLQATKRGEKWLSIYERKPSLSQIFPEALKALEKFILEADREYSPDANLFSV